MARLRWIILIGLTAISAVTAVTLGILFQKQKENLATRSGASLDDFFKANPSLDQTSCDGDVCANGYTREPVPDLLQDSPYSTCRTTASVSTRTQSALAVDPSTSTNAGSASSTTKATTSQAETLVASVTYPTQEWSTTTEAPYIKVISSLFGIASSHTGAVSVTPLPAS
ncbi:uncharacterized protein PG998_004305 [Apiospora kogelbergensis]|uniref:uncharacterized protein n=1 Tax=Apiospora kogelbergensis TaxID=1337665 RepID=UPI003130B14F